MGTGGKCHAWLRTRSVHTPVLPLSGFGTEDVTAVCRTWGSTSRCHWLRALHGTMSERLLSGAFYLPSSWCPFTERPRPPNLCYQTIRCGGLCTSPRVATQKRKSRPQSGHWLNVCPRARHTAVWTLQIHSEDYVI